MPSARFINILSIVVLIAAGIGALYIFTSPKNESSSGITIVNTGGTPGATEDNTPSKKEGSTLSNVFRIFKRDTTDTTPVDEVDESLPVPMITSVTPVAFGSDDSITIAGKNLTANSKIHFSIEGEDTFAGVYNETSGSLSIAPHFLITDSIAEGLVGLSPENKKAFLAKLIEKESRSSSYKDGWYIPVKVWVSNPFGTSNVVTVQVNVLKGI